MMFETILFGENQCKKNGILRLFFSVDFALNQVKYA